MLAGLHVDGRCCTAVLWPPQTKDSTIGFRAQNLDLRGYLDSIRGPQLLRRNRSRKLMLKSSCVPMNSGSYSQA